MKNCLERRWSRSPRRYNNRGVAWGQKGESDKALADYTRVIEELPGAPVEQIAKALYNRGVAWGQKGESDKALADYTRVIEELPGAPVEQIAKALNNRGVTWGQKGESDKELADYTRVIEELPGAPVEQIAKALNNRGVTWGQKGESDKALADYTRVIEELPGAPVEQIAKALNNRGVAWGQKGESDKALADYTRVIEELPGAPVEQIAKALNNRGWCRYCDNDLAGFLSDTETALTKYLFAEGAFNLGLALLANDRDSEALEAIGAPENPSPKKLRRGFVRFERGEKKWLSTERAEPVINLLPNDWLRVLPGRPGNPRGLRRARMRQGQSSCFRRRSKRCLRHLDRE